MNAERTLLDRQAVIAIAEKICEIHTLLAKEMLAGEASARVEEAEQKVHDLRNELAARTGLGFQFVVP